MNISVRPPLTAPVPPSVHFGGLRFTPLTVQDTVAALAARPVDMPFVTYVTPNAEHAWLRHSDAEFDHCCENAWLSTNDSRVLRKAARLAGIELEFAPGSYVVDALFAEVIQPGDPLTIIGGDERVIDILRKTFALSAVSHHNPPMGFIRDSDAVSAAIDFVAAHPARFVFVAMGPPQSEKFCQRVIEDGRATGIGLCIGSSINMITGQSPRAPDWMENAGMVWLYRLVREPRRLWQRYLVRGFFGLGLAIRDIAAFRTGRRSPAAPPSRG
jgi:N-acetylglucosaminyldiphosphoundecaprenol N-acetyl-beta-D-mannosaminyltransferase